MTTTIDTVQSFKILIIGDSNVGKTSLMNRMVHGVFNNNYTSTIGVDFKIATINIGEYKCRLQIWDTAGQERFRSMTSSYYRGADGIIIVYDVTNNESFENIKSRFHAMEIYLEENIPKILVGNKNDDNNQENKIVLTSDGKELAEQNKFLFFETSVKDNKNINEVFNRMTKLVLKRRIAQIKKQPNNVPIVVNPSMISKSKESNKSCCSM